MNEMTDETNPVAIDTHIHVGDTLYLRMIIKYLSGTKEVSDYAVVVFDGMGQAMGFTVKGWRRGCPVAGLVSYAMWWVIVFYDKTIARTGVTPGPDIDNLFGGPMPQHVPYYESVDNAGILSLDQDVIDEIVASLAPATA